MDIRRNPTRSVRIGSVTIGAEHPIAVQSMTATHTQDIDATVAQANDLHRAGADVVRIAVDSKKDGDALAEIRQQTKANLDVYLRAKYPTLRQRDIKEFVTLITERADDSKPRAKPAAAARARRLAGILPVGGVA